MEDFLRELTPAEVPPEVRRALFVGMDEARRRAIRTRVWLAAAAALVAAVPLGLWWVRAGGEERRPSADTALRAVPSEGADQLAEPADEVMETTDVVGMQDAGTTPTESGAYRIVLVTFVHRMWGAGENLPEGRVLSERTSQSYVAVPLEIF